MPERTWQEYVAAERLADVDADSREGLERARADWIASAIAEAERQAAAGPPAALEPVEVTAGGVSYAIYGVIHGYIGGESRAYRDFVRAGVKALDYPVMENGIRRLYSNPRVEEIPDFAVLGVAGSLWMGVLFGLQYPLLVFELLRELLRKDSPDAAFELSSGVLYHAVDPEVRRALGPDGDLPSRLSIAQELGRWDRNSLTARLTDPAALAPRSLYMAGYAVGAARRRGADRLALVVGDRHTAEIVRFLEDERWASHPLYLRGLRFGALPDGRRRLRFAGAKVGHLLLACLPFTAVIVPLFIYIRLWMLPPYPY